jgi:streptogramin lyase
MRKIVWGCALVALLGSAPAASAALVLTQAGINEGFSLSTVVNGIPNTGNFGIGPLAIGVEPGGRLLVGTWPNGELRSFSNTLSNQSWGSGTFVANYGTGNAHSLAFAGGNTYMVQKFGSSAQGIGTVVSLNPTTGATSLIRGGLGNPLDIVVNPKNGFLIVSGTNQGIVSINPANGQLTVLLANVFADGITISPDGKRLYAAVNGVV